MAAPDDAPDLTAEHSIDEAGRPVISVRGELDLASVSQVSAVARVVLESKPEQVVFDLSGLEFMDSSGLRVLLEVATQVGSVVVPSPSLAVRRVIESAGVDQILVLEP